MYIVFLLNKVVIFLSQVPLEFLGEVLRVLLGLLHFGELGVFVLFFLLEQTLHLLQLMLLLLFCLNMTTSVVMSHQIPDDHVCLVTDMIPVMCVRFILRGQGLNKDESSDISTESYTVHTFNYCFINFSSFYEDYLQQQKINKILNNFVYNFNT